MKVDDDEDDDDDNNIVSIFSIHFLNKYMTCTKENYIFLQN